MAKIYQIRIDLLGAKPPIWRRFLVEANMNLEQLHEIVQVVMGWHNYHLWQFQLGGEYYGPIDPDWDSHMRDASKVKLAKALVGEGEVIGYTYDFGDSWEHSLKLEKITEKEKGQHYPIVTKGKRNCPPEDCGGIWGYEEFLQAIKNKKHPEHEDMLDWVGGEFDPEEFDMEDINQTLKQHF